MIKTLSAALAERGYDTLTEVQTAVTAPELRDADLLVSAQTGSGKTVGFGLAIAHNLLGEAEHLGPAAAPLALIVAPTRELALQVMRELAWLYAGAGARVASCVGGMDIRDERRALERGAHIVVGTPGRLRDHIQRGSLDMTGLRAVVLDEADEMLDLGFREDLEFMLAAAPAERRTLMFSATVPPQIATLAKQFQRDAVRVTTQSGATQHSDITYQALTVAPQDAEPAIFNLLRFHAAENAIVFANTRAAVSHLSARLANRGFAVVTLSGELSQSERTHALQAMRDGRARVCVATDVAARGIDLPGLELVIHADLPSNAEGLLHRSGRTGRAGRKGISAIIVTPKIAKKAERLLKFAKIKAEWTSAPGADDILRRDEERLLNDPIWSDEATGDQAAFAAKLLERHPPEKIAAAYLALYRARLSAPEELSAPDAKRAPTGREDFGPGIWFALSVGRDQNAEPRWLLPLLCRAGNLEKESIGAIRVQQTETYVELSAAAVPGFLGTIGSALELEDGVTVRRLDGPPDLSTPTYTAGPPKPERRPAKEASKGRGPAPRPAPLEPGRRMEPSKPADHAAKPERTETPRPPRAPKVRPVPAPLEPPVREEVPRRTETDRAGARPARHPGKDAGDRPSPTKPHKARRTDNAEGGSARPFRPRDERSGGARSEKPGSGAPRAKSAPAKPARFDASDPSKRVSRPGKPDRPRSGGPDKGKHRPGGPGRGGKPSGGGKR